MLKPIILIDIDGTIIQDWYLPVIFPDVKKFFARSVEAYELGLYSQGLVWLQLFKLLLIDHLKFFKKEFRYISLNKTGTIPKILKNYPGRKVVIVDNRLDMLQRIQKVTKDITLIHINRLDTNEVAEGILTIKSFEELPDILKKLIV